MTQPLEQPPRTEFPPFPFLLASRFDSIATSQAPHDTIQTIVRDQEVAEFSVFRMIQNWLESMSKAPPGPKGWYGAVIGHPNGSKSGKGAVWAVVASPLTAKAVAPTILEASNFLHLSQAL